MAERRQDAEIARDVAYSLAQALYAEAADEANPLAGVAVTICRADGTTVASSVATEDAVGDPRIQMAATLLHGALDGAESPALRRPLVKALRCTNEAVRTRRGTAQSRALH